MASKKGAIPIALSIAGIVAVLAILFAAGQQLNNMTISGYAHKDYCSRIAENFEKYYEKSKCLEDNESQRCHNLVKKYTKRISERCTVSASSGDELLFTGTATGWEDNGANDKVESGTLSSYDYNELTGYKLKWKSTAVGYEDYSGKEYKILYNTPKCTNQGCVILEGFDIADGESNSVNGWKFEVTA